MSDEFAKLIEENLLRPRLSSRQTSSSVFRVLEPSTPEHFMDAVDRNISGAVEEMRRDMSRARRDVISAHLTHEVTDVEYAGEMRKQHEFTIVFTCTGLPEELPPRAQVMRAMGEWLRVDDVNHIGIGMHLVTPAGVRVVRMVDPVCGVVRLDGNAGEKSFPVFALGDPYAEEMLAKWTAGGP